MIEKNDLPPGLKELQAEFEFIDEVGRGGMAVVYRARDRRVDREVALKVLHPGRVVDEEAAKRIEREARVAAQLEHPHIVSLYGVRQIDETGLVLVMQFVRGPTVEEAIRNQGAFSPEKTCKVLGQVAEALGYAHDQGIIHRDIKPGNIFLETDSGRALLGDFGVAKARHEPSNLTREGTSIGTPNYMAPEAIEGRVQPQSDLYALGLVGWEMLTGQQPWEGESLYTVIAKQKNDSLTPISAFRSDVPVSLRQAIERALAKDPNDRWAKAQSFRQALESPTSRKTSIVSQSVVPGVDRISGVFEGTFASATKILRILAAGSRAVVSLLFSPRLLIGIAILAAATGAYWFSSQNRESTGGSENSGGEKYRLVALADTIESALNRGDLQAAGRFLSRFVAAGGSDAAAERWRKRIRQLRSQQSPNAGGGREEGTERSSGNTGSRGNPSENKADSEKSPVSSPKPATLRVATNVENARVFVRPADGGNFEPMGRAGKSFQLEPGRYVLELRTPYHSDWTTTRSFQAGETYVIRKNDYATTGRLLIATTPTWANVHLEGREVQATPRQFDSLPVGPHEVTIRREGFQTIVDTVMVRPGRMTSETYQLQGSDLE